MRVTYEMRVKRALRIIEAESEKQEKELEELERINLTPIVILRNKKRMYIAEVDQLKRKLRDQLEENRETEAAEARA